MAIKKSPSLKRAEIKLKKLLKEVKSAEKRVKQLTAKDEKAAKAPAKKPAKKKTKPASKKKTVKKTTSKVTAEKTAPKAKKTTTKK